MGVGGKEHEIDVSHDETCDTDVSQETASDGVSVTQETVADGLSDERSAIQARYSEAKAAGRSTRIFRVEHEGVVTEALFDPMVGGGLCLNACCLRPWAP